MARDTLEKIMQAGKSLRWRIVAVLLFAALIPLALAGFGSWIVFGDLLERKSWEQMRTLVESHAGAIDAYLSEHLHLLQLAAESHTLQEMSDPDRLRRYFDDLNASSGKGFVDLGVIDSEGNHLAYFGPYNLQDRNYRDADWFTEVGIQGKYISDVFLGYRQVPHCIIAVQTVDDNRRWILRATINSDEFDALVKTGALGTGSDAYIVNREGLYQSTPKSGALLDAAPGIAPAVHPGVRDQRVVIDGATMLRVTTWINDNRWMLVEEQELASVQAPVNQAIARGAYVVLVAVVFLVLITFFATRHLTALIDKATAEREEFSRAFIRSAKLASIGELTTGLAHEINNPLAIISAEQTNIADVLGDMTGEDEAMQQARASVERSQSQVRRCADITKKLLQFGRSKESHPEPTDIGARLTDIVNLMSRHAKVRNVSLKANIRDDLPQALVDPVELEQVLVNLINNALDAMPSGGDLNIAASLDKESVVLEVTDTGTGIAPDTIDRIFEPFFTTKPVGRGTGLGLSVCYGIVNSWGGTIEAHSTQGEGTTIRIVLPPYRQNGKS